MVGHPESKQWWRNFSEPRDLEVLVRSVWCPMRGRAIVGAQDPETVRPLLEIYLKRFPLEPLDCWMPRPPTSKSGNRFSCGAGGDEPGAF